MQRIITQDWTWDHNGAAFADHRVPASGAAAAVAGAIEGNHVIMTGVPEDFGRESRGGGATATVVSVAADIETRPDPFGCPVVEPAVMAVVWDHGTNERGEPIGREAEFFGAAGAGAFWAAHARVAAARAAADVRERYMARFGNIA